MKRFMIAAALSAVSLFAMAQDYFIESRSGGVNFADYSDVGMSNSSAAKSTVSPTPGIGVRYCTLSILNKTVTFAPSGLESGVHSYNIYYTGPNSSTLNATDTTWRVNTASGLQTGTFDATQANSADKWQLIGQFELDSESNPYIEFDTSTSNGGESDGGKRFYADAVRFELAVDPPDAIVDGVGTDPGTYTTLSAAVDAVQTAGDGPHLIHVTADVLTDSGQIVISEPMTIVGDADGNDTSADIAVDAATIDGSLDVGAAGRYYIEIAAEGAVTISDLNIHATTGGADVGGIGTFKPAAGVGEYTLDNVKLSGSAAGAYLAVDTSVGQLAAAGTAVWNGAAVINISNNGGAGTYNATLNNVHAGVGTGNALALANTSGETTVNGGAFAHTSDDIVYVTGTGVTFTGSETNRVRVFKPTEAENLRVDSGAVVDLMEYVDSGLPDGSWNSSPFALYGGTVTQMQFCRGFADGTGSGAAFYAASDATANVENSTFHSDSDDNAVSITNGNTGTVTFTNCIFTRDTPAPEDTVTGIYVGGNAGPYTFTNSALPTDGVTNESLDATNPFQFQDAAADTATTDNNTVTASPIYELAPHTAGVTNYDYSDAGAGNPDFLRPTNSAAYTGVADGGGNLTGGAGGTAVPVTLSGFSIE